MLMEDSAIVGRRKIFPHQSCIQCRIRCKTLPLSALNGYISVLQSVSHREHGICDIEQKITSPQNPRFVVHDSRGFEPGAVDHLNLVKTFLQEREKAELKDQVHAVWQVSSVGYGYLLRSVSGFVSKFRLPEDAYSRKVMKSL